MAPRWTVSEFIFVLCIMIASANIIQGENSIPNGGFETWSSITYSNPLNYPYSSNGEMADLFLKYEIPFNVVQTTDAYHGYYAVQLSSVEFGGRNGFGYFLNSNPKNGNPTTWKGGAPYSEIPTGIRGYYKYNVENTDSATIIIVFNKAGSNIGTYFFKLGGIKTDYELFDFSFSPALTQTPDSVIFAAILVSENGIPGSVLKIDSISFTGVNTQPDLLNGDFETWQDYTIHTPGNWYIENGASRTTEAYSGNYAIKLNTYLGQDNGVDKARPGRISTGYYLDNCNENCIEQGGYPYTNQIDTLVFYYKYTPSGNDSAQVSLNFKKNGNNIFFVAVDLHSSATFQQVEIPFEVWQSPDSVIVDIQSSNWEDSLVSFVGSELIVDNIYFKSQGEPTGLFNYKNSNGIQIIPNPAFDFITVNINNVNDDFFTLNIYNNAGTLVKSETQVKNQQKINVADLPNGTYIISVKTKDSTKTEKLKIQR